MSAEFKPFDEKHCYTCIQWEGQRSWGEDKKTVKVDEKQSANCLLLHKSVRGDSFCDHFFPIR